MRRLLELADTRRGGAVRLPSAKGGGDPARRVERCLQFGVYFLGQGDCRVVVRTGGVGVVDDVVVDEEEESRVRRVSFVEVGVRLR